jgi:integrase
VFWPPREGPLVPYAPQSITKMYRTLAGDGGLRPHQLRHFSVTQLLAAGVPEVEVMGRHGHASASSMKPCRHYIRAKDQMSTTAIEPHDITVPTGSQRFGIVSVTLDAFLRLEHLI